MPKEDTQFQPGNPGGPGRPPEADPRLKAFTKKEIQESVCKLLRLTVRELSALAQENDTKSLDVIIAHTIKECIKKGDFWALDKMLERVIGKVPQKQELTGADGAPLTPPRLIYYEIPDPDEQPGPK